AAPARSKRASGPNGRQSSGADMESIDRAPAPGGSDDRRPLMEPGPRGLGEHQDHGKQLQGERDEGYEGRERRTTELIRYRRQAAEHPENEQNEKNDPRPVLPQRDHPGDERVDPKAHGEDEEDDGAVEELQCRLQVGRVDRELEEGNGDGGPDQDDGSGN